jgi:GNAT superfamily N-acetyltransferase
VPPRLEEEAAWIRAALGRPHAWGLVAACAGEPAGHVVLRPAAHDGPRAAYLWQLFVRPRWWGTGLADVLHDATLAEARARGYPRAALNTPAGNVRARRFYERRGWRVEGPLVTFDDGMPMATYRRALLP